MPKLVLKKSPRKMILKKSATPKLKLKTRPYAPNPHRTA